MKQGKKAIHLLVVAFKKLNFTFSLNNDAFLRDLC